MTIQFYDTNLSWKFVFQMWRIGFSVDYWYAPIGRMWIPISVMTWIQDAATYARKVGVKVHSR